MLENAIYSISAGYPAWPIAMWILHYETRPRWDAVRQSDISGWWGSTATGNKKSNKTASQNRSKSSVPPAACDTLSEQHQRGEQETGYAAPVTAAIRCHKHPFMCFWSLCTMLLLACAPACGCTGASAQCAVARISPLHIRDPHQAGICVFTAKPKSMGLPDFVLCILVWGF